jgi:hypothetical protein
VIPIPPARDRLDRPAEEQTPSGHLSSHSSFMRQLLSERASSSFSGSSIRMMSAPRPVSTPPVEVANR